ncbi:MAG: ribbon-helix-helix domain-containing protein [Thiopseudomonas sp.]|jgi:RHH-type rel operon transcriptional repressor/antitoxin RelB|nr:ribbon-helix-helix domain-containing protein [Thiopseudomonas sp.]
MSTLTNVSLRLPVELVERVNKLAEATGRSKTYYMRKAISDQITELESLYLSEQERLQARANESSPSVKRKR